MVRAIALVGFYRGVVLVKPGDIIELSRDEFAMHKAFNQVDYAPEAPKPPVKGK
jgi:hypothetical protein